MMRAEAETSIFPRSLNFGIATFLIAATLLGLMGAVVTVESATPAADDQGQRRRKCSFVRGCLAFLTRRSATLPLWKSLLIKAGVFMLTTLGSAGLSLLLSNVTAPKQESIRDTVAAILEIDLEENRQKRSTCFDCSQDTSGYTSMSDNICTLILGGAQVIDQMECATAVTMVLTGLAFAAALTMPIIIVFMLLPAIQGCRKPALASCRRRPDRDDDIESLQLKTKALQGDHLAQ